MSRSPWCSREPSRTVAPMFNAEVAIIGGSGLYDFFADSSRTVVDTPYGAPSGPISIGSLDDRSVAFLPRHGDGHAYPPHAINYRANLWALASLGVKQILAPCAVGGLTAKLETGALVAPDQVVDRTTSRVSTFVTSGALHAPFADPYCARLRGALARQSNVVRGGTMVVIEGPRFSSRAESRAYAAAGWELINMTGCPEAALARELGICYQPLALITDLDAGLAEGEGVHTEDVLALFAANLPALRRALVTWLGDLPDATDCDCRTWTEPLEFWP